MLRGYYYLESKIRHKHTARANYISGAYMVHFIQYFCFCVVADNQTLEFIHFDYIGKFRRVKSFTTKVTYCTPSGYIPQTTRCNFKGSASFYIKVEVESCWSLEVSTSHHARE